MTKVTMPEPVAYRSKESPYLFSLGGPETDGFDGLITTDQAEAYAAARVLEALRALQAERDTYFFALQEISHPEAVRGDATAIARNAIDAEKRP